jgi:hypothetical protein
MQRTKSAPFILFYFSSMLFLIICFAWYNCAGLAFLQVPFVSFAVCGGTCHVMAQWRLS